MTCRSYEILDSAHIKRLEFRAPYGRFSLIAYYPLFWIWIFCNLLIYKPKFVHACDLDSLIPSYVFRILFSIKLVFDSFDRYAMAFIPPKYRAIYALVNMIENVLASKVDALVTVSKERSSTFGNYKPKCSEVILNCPEDKLEMIKRRSVSYSSGRLVLVYAGRVSRDRGIFIIGKALQSLKDVHLILAGRICDDSIERFLKSPRTKYVGLLQYNKALELQASADIIPILYDPSVPINCVASPNKLFEAMMLGVPVITNVCSDVVNQVGCGLVVEYDSNSVKDAVLCLKNNSSLRKEMGANARIAFEKTYNWSSMEKKLLRLYHQLSIS